MSKEFDYPVRMFMVGQGVIVGYEESVENNIIKLKWPLQLDKGMPGVTQATIKTIYLDETWCKIPLNGAMELEVSDGVNALYTSKSKEIYDPSIVKIATDSDVKKAAKKANLSIVKD